MLYLRSPDHADSDTSDEALDKSRKDGIFVGFTSIYVRPPSTALQLGYAIVPTYQSKGYATEAVGTTLRHWFDVLGVQEVEAMTTESNMDSMRVARKCGGVLMEEGEAGKDGGEVRGKAMREWAKKMHGTGESFVGYVFTKERTNRALR